MKRKRAPAVTPTKVARAVRAPAVNFLWSRSRLCEWAGGVGEGHGEGLGVDIQTDIFDGLGCGRWVHNGIEAVGLAE